MEGTPIELVWSAQYLERMGRGRSFARGIFTDEPSSINITNTGNVVRWVAQKDLFGGGWCIRYQPPELGYLAKNFGWVTSNGAVLRDHRQITQLVPADVSMMALYRG